MSNLIGTGPNQVPLNGQLGTMAYQNKEGPTVDQISVGPFYAANQNRFANAIAIISTTPPTIQQNEIHNIGLVSEGVASNTDPSGSIWGVGVYGIGYTNGASRSGGVIGESHVFSSSDTGSAIGVRGYSQDTHSGGLNIGVLADSSNSSVGNYGFYSNIPAATNNFSLYMSGNSSNYFAGKVGIGTTGLVALNLNVSAPITGGTTSYGIYQAGTVQSDVTGSSYGFINFALTQAASFTCGTVVGYGALQSTIGAGSTVTNQFGFYASPSLTGATNNYGFYSNIASATNAWNFYANGSAPNYFAGSVGIGATSLTGVSLSVSKNITGAVTSEGIYNAGVIQSDVTNSGQYYASVAYTAAAAFTLGDLRHYNAAQGTFGVGSTVTSQYGFFATPSLTGATSNYGFFSNIASASNAWNFYANGSAPNYFAGNVTIGTTTIASGYSLTTNAPIYLNNQATDITPTSAWAGQVTAAGNGYRGGIALDATGLWLGHNSASRAIVFATANTERARIDSTGNFGLGVTPSAWLNLKAFQFGSGSVYATSSTSESGLTLNSYYDGSSWKYISTATATRYIQATGSHLWYTAPSGTAGANITFTQAMTLDASGNLGIGTTSAVSKLDVLGNVNNSATGLNSNDSATIAVRNLNSAALQVKSKVNFGLTDGSGTYGYASIAGIYSNYNGTADIGTSLAFGTQFNAAGGTVERMRIDSSGNVGIGTTAPGSKLEVNGIISSNRVLGGGSYDGVYRYANSGNVYTYSDGSYLASYTSNTERMRIDSSGNVGIGTTTLAAKLNVSGAGGPLLGLSGNSSANQTSDFGITRTSSNTVIQQAPCITFSDGTTNNTRTIQNGSGNLQFFGYRGSWIEDMRLDTSGNLLVGTTAASPLGGAGSVSIKGGIGFLGGSASTYYYTIQSNTTDFYIGNSALTRYAALIGISSFTAWSFSSDKRIKRDIESLDYGLNEVMKLRPTRYKFLDSDDPCIGFIAQDVLDVIPEMVNGSGADFSDEDTPTERADKTLKLSKETLVPVLVKAIQELKAELDELKLKVN